MSVQLTIEVKEKYVHVTARGDFEMEDAKQGIFKVIQVSHENKLARVLTDIRGVNGPHDMMDRYEYVLFLVGGIKQHFGHLLSDIRLAYVGDPDPEDTYSPMVVEQSGVNIFTTTGLEDAIAWIEAEES